MVLIPKEIKEFIVGKMAWVATVSQNGIPNLAPKGSLKVIDDETLVFADIFSLKTRSALEQNPKIAVAVIDAEKPEGYQLKGEAELINSGSLYEQIKEELKKVAPSLPEPKYIAKIKIQEIYSLTPGPNAGKKIV